MIKTLDRKLDGFRTAASTGDFLLADAKDADMAFGISAPGLEFAGDGATRPRSIQEFRQQVREVVEDGLIDIMLMSVSTGDQLARVERLFDRSAVTPAIRANDSTDIWLAGTQASYAAAHSMPFRTASIDHAMGGREGCDPAERAGGIDLGLYSITLNNDVERDHATLSAYKEFRREAELKGFRHFLEVFAPNVAGSQPLADVPRFVNDSIVRLLAGVAAAGRPIFLKIPYFGPKPMSELAAYDTDLVIGVLGGASGTTRDALQLLADAKRNGARAALFGRKINSAEHQVAFVRVLRLVADGQLDAAEGVRLYHAELEKRGIAPRRSLTQDLEVTHSSLSYG